MEATTQQSRASSLHCLYAGMRTYVDFALENPSDYYVTFLLNAPEESPDVVYPEVHRAGMQAFDYLRRAIQRAIRDGHLREGEIELVSQTAWAGIHGVASLLVTMCGEFPFADHQKLVDHTICTLLIGLGATPESVKEAMAAKEFAAR